MFTLRPIVTWPGVLRSAHARRASQFRASYRDTLQILDEELVALQGQHVVVQLAVDEQDIRLDGELRANVRPAHPGVILSFESVRGALNFATDAFDEPTYRRGEAWHANLRAIALGMRALRAVDRYGISGNGEQYTGWKAIGSGGYTLGERMTVGEAAVVFADLTGAGMPEEVLAVAASGDPMKALRGLYRKTVKCLHPDVNDGGAEQFRALEEAWAVLMDSHPGL